MSVTVTLSFATFAEAAEFFRAAPERPVAGGAKAEKAPAEKAPAEKAPAEKAPAEKAPPPAEKAPPEKPQAEKPPATKPAPEESQAAEAPAGGTSYADLSAQVLQIAAQPDGVALVKAVFAKLGVKNGKEIPPKRYAYAAELLKVAAACGDVDDFLAEVGGE